MRSFSSVSLISAWENDRPRPTELKSPAAIRVSLTAFRNAVERLSQVPHLVVLRGAHPKINGNISRLEMNKEHRVLGPTVANSYEHPGSELTSEPSTELGSAYYEGAWKATADKNALRTTPSEICH